MAQKKLRLVVHVGRYHVVNSIRFWTCSNKLKTSPCDTEHARSENNQPGETPVTAGSRIHMDIAQAEAPKLGGNGRGVNPGQTGPDWLPPPKVHANFDEIKPITSDPGAVARQAQSWGFPAENPNGPTISTGRYIFYDRQTGQYWMGIIAP